MLYDYKISLFSLGKVGNFEWSLFTWFHFVLESNLSMESFSDGNMVGKSWVLSEVLDKLANRWANSLEIKSLKVVVPN